jgi:selenocysteine lyase/cysteine desulfurase
MTTQSHERGALEHDTDGLREREFPITREWRFFNHAACSPLPQRAVRAMERQAREHALSGNLGNPTWQRTRETARVTAAGLMNARPDDIAFVSNTAEGINVVAHGLDWREGDNVVTANVEYPANMYPWLNIVHRGVAVRKVAEKDGRIAIGDVAAAIDARTRVVALSWVEFASGYRNDLVALGELCRQRGVLFVVDAIQGLGALPIDVREANIGVLASGGQKWLLGPRGCGLLYCSPNALDALRIAFVGAYSVVDDHNFLKYDLTLKPSARRFEYGTENAAGIAGLGASLELLAGIGIPAIAARIGELTNYFCDRVRSKGYAIASSREAGETSGLVFFEKRGTDANALGARLQEARFVLSVRDGRLRFAPHVYNTVAEIDDLVSALT